MVSHSQVAKQYATSIYEIKNQQWHQVSITEPTIRQSESVNEKRVHTKSSTLKKWPILKNKKMYIISLSLISLLLVIFLLKASIQNNMSQEQTLLLYHTTDVFEDHGIEQLQSEKGIFHVEYFYEIFSDQYIIQSYDHQQMEREPLGANEAIITNDLAKLLEVSEGDFVTLPELNQSYMIHRVIEKPIYALKNGVYNKYIYISQDQFPPINSLSLIVYMDDFESYTQLSEKLIETDVNLEKVMFPWETPISEQDIFVERLHNQIINWMIIVFIILNVLVKVYIFMSTVYSLALLSVNGIPLHEIKTLLKKQSLDFLKYEILMIVLMDGVAIMFHLVPMSLMTIGLSVVSIFMIETLVYLTENFFLSRISLNQLLRF